VVEKPHSLENPMKKRAIQALSFGVIASALAYGQQTAKPDSTAPNPSVAPGAKQTEPAKPAAPPQDPTATTSTTPAPPASANEDKSVTPNNQSDASQAKDAQKSKAQESQLPQSDASVSALDTSGLSSAQLQQKIEAALHSEPTLNGSDLTVNVTDDEINVTGTVGSGKHRTTASRIVQSFGENRKVKEKINVSGVKK
jgi:hypothetical protein